MYDFNLPAGQGMERVARKVNVLECASVKNQKTTLRPTYVNQNTEERFSLWVSPTEMPYYQKPQRNNKEPDRAGRVGLGRQVGKCKSAIYWKGNMDFYVRLRHH